MAARAAAEKVLDFDLQFGRLKVLREVPLAVGCRWIPVAVIAEPASRQKQAESWG